jgi:hypothetical protein
MHVIDPSHESVHRRPGPSDRSIHPNFLPDLAELLLQIREEKPVDSVHI